MGLLTHNRNDTRARWALYDMQECGWRPKIDNHPVLNSKPNACRANRTPGLSFEIRVQTAQQDIRSTTHERPYPSHLRTIARWDGGHADSHEKTITRLAERIVSALAAKRSVPCDKKGFASQAHAKIISYRQGVTIGLVSPNEISGGKGSGRGPRGANPPGQRDTRCTPNGIRHPGIRRNTSRRILGGRRVDRGGH